MLFLFPYGLIVALIAYARRIDPHAHIVSLKFWPIFLFSMLGVIAGGIVSFILVGIPVLVMIYPNGGGPEPLLAFLYLLGVAINIFSPIYAVRWNIRKQQEKR